MDVPTGAFGYGALFLLCDVFTGKEPGYQQSNCLIKGDPVIDIYFKISAAEEATLSYR
jgi:hypothetical protein